MVTTLLTLWLLVAVNPVTADIGLILNNAKEGLTESQVPEGQVAPLVVEVIEAYLQDCHLIVVTSNPGSFVFSDIIR